MVDGGVSGGLLASALFGFFCMYGAVRFLLRRQLRDHEVVNWTALEAISLTVAIFFTSQIVAALSVAVVGGAFGFSGKETINKVGELPFYQFLSVALIDIVSIGLVYMFMKRRRTPWRAIGWVAPRWRDVGYALAGFGVYFAIYGFIVFRLVETLLPQIDTDQPQQLGFDTSVVGPELIFVFLSLVILPPLVEEILVRGFLFTGLRNRFTLIPATIITSVIFAAAHLQWGSGQPLLWTAAIDTFMLSLVLIWLRHKTGSLWPGIGVHFIKNGIAFLVLFVFKTA